MSKEELGNDIVVTADVWSSISQRFNDISNLLLSNTHDSQSGPSLRKENAFLSQIINLKDSIIDIRKNIFALEEEKKAVEGDFIALLNDEIKILQDEEHNHSATLKELMLPSTEEPDRSLFLEIRAGTGGLEASLFAGDLAKMYFLYGGKKGWTVSYAHIAETDVGGFREIILSVEGKNVYKNLQYEGGVHRVQRVPETETSGRIHTSTVAIAVLPEVEDVEVSIDQKDLRVDTYRASGAGGQHVNKTDSAIRITHIPSGIVVSCQEERSQHKNRARAMKMLNSRLFAMEKEKQESKMSQLRKEMSGSAERADKVRTYNYPQNRVTDHRIGLTVSRLEYIMQGELDDIIEPLVRQYSENRKPHPFLEKYLI
jgi:peptide chain release factor 1